MPHHIEHKLMVTHCGSVGLIAQHSLHQYRVGGVKNRVCVGVQHTLGLVIGS